MLEFLWEMEQQRRIAEADTQASRAARDASDARRASNVNEARLDTMALTIMAMWSILQDRFGVNEADLVKRMQEIDLRDGKLDGKVAPTSSSCGKCSRVMSSRYKRCIYCGGESLDLRPIAGL